MRRRVEDLSPERLPFAAPEVRDDDRDDLPFGVPDLGRSAVVRLEVRHDGGRLVIGAVHFPGGGAVRHREDSIVRKMRIAHESRPARDPSQQHAG